MSHELIKTIGVGIPLGQKTSYPNYYDAGLLCAVPRFKQREALGFSSTLAFFGADLWNAYELCFQNMKGKPMRALATLVVPCNSPFIAESKSVKLYLNSINDQKFATINDVKKLLEQDLSSLCQDTVKVELIDDNLNRFFMPDEHGFYCLDELDINVKQYNKNPELLEFNEGENVCDKVVTHLFKSHCLVTRQPDWGSIFIEYEGPRIVRESLLAYLISYHDHIGFSENCIEQIYVDILQRVRPKKLVVTGRFTRRGGIDINPTRSNGPIDENNWRVIYQ